MRPHAPPEAFDCRTHAPHAAMRRHAPPHVVTRRWYLPRASRAHTRQSTRTHAPHAPAAASLPATSALGDVTLPRHPLTVDSDR